MQIYAALYVILCPNRPDIVFLDLVSVCTPVLKLRIPLVVFYCHYPDQLLATRQGRLRSLYRKPLNYLEEITTGMADEIFVNSNFTRQVFERTFVKLSVDKTRVLYPSINTRAFDGVRILPLDIVFNGNSKIPEGSRILLSINRFERKKKLSSAIEALAELRNYLSPEEFERTHLILAGGYDKRVEENVEYFLELLSLADELKIPNNVSFLRSPSDDAKISVLTRCDVLIYTPPDEHFGIVPLEAMYASKPVIAHDSGGPRETVVNGETGFLVPTTRFAEKLATLLKNDDLRLRMGKAGRARFDSNFSFDSFSTQLNAAIEELAIKQKTQ